MWNKVVGAPLLDISLTARSRTRAAARSLFAATFACLQLSCLMTVAQASVDSPPQETPLLVGFNIGGFDWARAELRGIEDPDRIVRILEEIGYIEAAMIHEVGGNAMRIFYAPSSFGQLSFDALIAVGRMSIEERLEYLDAVDRNLRAALKRLPENKTFTQKPINWLRSDAYLDGVARFNAGIPSGERIRVLLTEVSAPPRVIIECPSTATLGYYQRAYTAETLWTQYIEMTTQMTKKLIRRYLTRYPAEAPLIVAIELGNEPDYWWIPDEMKIERSEADDSSPMDKYIGELFVGQIPVNDHINKSFESWPYGYRPQDIEWDDAEAVTPIIGFKWGRKFDRYVRYFSKLHGAIAEAVKEETQALGQNLKIISAAVTHVNVDYLIRMHQENPKVFDKVDSIGLHPYHWPEHHIWNSAFVSDEPIEGWRQASPRAFAKKFFKRFDFLQVVARMTQLPDPVESHGMAGKKLWLTEFGIPTKKLGKANDSLRSLDGHFIYERGEFVPEDVKAAVWEDLWDAFFDQVDRDFLVENEVEALFFFFLREGISDSSNDDFSSNLAMIDANGRHRLDPPTLKKFEQFIRSLTLKQRRSGRIDRR